MESILKKSIIVWALPGTGKTFGSKNGSYIDLDTFWHETIKPGMGFKGKRKPWQADLALQYALQSGKPVLTSCYHHIKKASVIIYHQNYLRWKTDIASSQRPNGKTMNRRFRWMGYQTEIEKSSVNKILLAENQWVGDLFV